MTQEREAFEAAYSAAYPWTVENTPDCFEQTASGNYEITGVMVGWRMWQARASLAQPASVPHPGSPEASAMIDSELAAHGWPSNAKNAARAGYKACSKLLAAAPQAPQPAQADQAAPPAPEVPQGPRTEFVLNELRSALNAMLTFFGMDEDENSKAVFDKARQAYNYAEIAMRPLEPWERQSLEDFRACVHRWHEKAVAKGYDGVESMCDTALPYGTRDLHLVSPSLAVAAPQPAQAADAERFRWLIDDRNWSENEDTPSICTSEDVHWGDKARALIDRHMNKD